MLKVMTRLLVAGVLSAPLAGCSTTNKEADCCGPECQMDKNGKAVVQNEPKPTMKNATTQPSAMHAH